MADQHKIDESAVNGRCEYPQSRIHIDGFLVDFYEGVAQSIDVGDSGGFVSEVFYTQDPANAFEVEATLQIGTIHRYRTDRLHFVVAVYVAQVSQVHGVLGCFLGMASEPEYVESQFTPLLFSGWLGWQLPLWRPAADPEPGEDHAEDLSGLIYFQFRGSRCRGIRSRNALAGRIVLKPVKRTDEATIAHLAADLRPQV